MSQVEQWLAKQGIDYTTEWLRPDEIDTDASRHNQARDKAIDSDLVQQYRDAMKRGDHFPPLVAYRNTQGRVILVDGNHRHEAETKNKSEEPMQVLMLASSTPLETIRTLTWEANIKNGMPPTPDERKNRATQLVQSGVAVDEVMRITGLTKPMVNQAMGDSRAQWRADRLGVSDFMSIVNSTHRERLGTIHLDGVFIAACRYVIDTKPADKAVRSLLKAVKAERTEAAQLELVASAVREQSTLTSNQKNSLKIRSEGRHAILMHGGALIKVTPEGVKASCLTLSEEEKQRTRDSIKGLVIHLQGLANAV